MKNVFLIGNGFDLHHKLPTRYYDFLCILKYYMKKKCFCKKIKLKDIYESFNEEENLAECYKMYPNIYEDEEMELSLDEQLAIADVLQVRSKKQEFITEKVSGNIWARYFLDTLDTDTGWIDFEREISTVVNTLNRLISEENVVNLGDNPLDLFILSKFGFFIDAKCNEKLYKGEYSISEKYCKEYPYKSGIYMANKEAIFEDLYKQLLELSGCLKAYLKSFVEKCLDVLSKDTNKIKNKIELLKWADVIVTFNYTNTVEKLYKIRDVVHIHGKIDDRNLVLGVNPNETDEGGISNASIMFKKYYQRELYGTDSEYINWYRKTIGANADYRVITIGHSLDETDSDILKGVFINAKEIVVTYLDEKRKEDYMKNICKMFGNGEFTKLKIEKNLIFIPLADIDALEDRIKPIVIEMEDTYGEKIEAI